MHATWQRAFPHPSFLLCACNKCVMSTLHNRCTGGALQALTDNRLADTSKKGNQKSCVKITRLFPFELAGSYHRGSWYSVAVCSSECGVRERNDLFCQRLGGWSWGVIS